MARGKHGAIAERRREIQGYQSEIETYKHNVKRLTEENRELKQKLKAEQEGRRQDVRALKAQLAEGLTPELLAMRKEVDKSAERAAAAEARNSQREKQMVTVVSKMTALLRHFGISSQVGWAILLRLLGKETVKRVAATKGNDAIVGVDRLSDDAADRILDARVGAITQFEQDALDVAERIGRGKEAWSE